MLIILLEQFHFIYLNLAFITYATVHTVQHSHNVRRRHVRHAQCGLSTITYLKLLLSREKHRRILTLYSFRTTLRLESYSLYHLFINKVSCHRSFTDIQVGRKISAGSRSSALSKGDYHGRRLQIPGISWPPQRGAEHAMSTKIVSRSR